MIDPVDIREFISEGKRGYVSDVRIRPSDEMVLIYVPKNKIAAKVQPGYTSLRQIENLRKKIEEEFSVRAQIIQTAISSHQELESGFYQLLNHKFEGRILSFFISFREESLLDAWIEVSGLNGVNRDEIAKHIENLFKESSLSVGEIFWLSSSTELPTFPALLRLVKAYQPISVQDLLLLLVGEYPSVNEKWLTHRLDALRRKEFLIWQKPGSYALTTLGVSAVPTGKSRSSSDIHRALVLGRRK